MNRTPSGFLAPNQVLRGRYFILYKISEGGFGAVYKAKDNILGNRYVAIKEMMQQGLSQQRLQEASEAFEREAYMLGGLHHQNLPRIHDYFEDVGYWYLVMEFIDGDTLDEYWNKKGKKLPPEEVLDIGIQLCTVLDYLHTHQPQIIFRDLKPLNIMRMSDGYIYLIDFGIARFFIPGKPRDTFLLISAGYSPKEQYGKAQTTPRSDLYSLGATLHQLLSGDDPSENPFYFAPLRFQGDPRLAPLEDLILQMVQMDMDNRPPSASFVKQKLQQIQATPKIPVAPPVRPQAAQPHQPVAPRQPAAPALPNQPQGQQIFVPPLQPKVQAPPIKPVVKGSPSFSWTPKNIGCLVITLLLFVGGLYGVIASVSNHLQPPTIVSIDALHDQPLVNGITPVSINGHASLGDVIILRVTFNEVLPDGYNADVDYSFSNGMPCDSTNSNVTNCTLDHYGNNSGNTLGYYYPSCIIGDNWCDYVVQYDKPVPVEFKAYLIDSNNKHVGDAKTLTVTWS